MRPKPHVGVKRARLAARFGLIAAGVMVAGLFLMGAGSVPFHPDESTFIYMSRDFDLLFLQGRPAAVTWVAPDQPADVLRYRLLDAPLGRYLAGLGRWLAGQPATARDWDWSAGWEANLAAGALPDRQTLAAARLPAALLTALACGICFALAQRLSGPLPGLAAATLFCLSGLVLLHGRRAMSEGPLLGFTLLTMWLAVARRPRPISTGVALAAAIAAKLTALTLVPAVFVAFLPPTAHWRTRSAWRQALARLAICGGVSLASLWALNPALWAAPMAGLRVMQQARQAFLDEQTAFVQAVAPHARLEQPGLRALAMAYHVYFAPVAYADVGQYATATATGEREYASQPLHMGWHTANLTLNITFGGLVFGLTLLGLALGLGRLWTERNAPAGASAEVDRQRALALVVVWTAATVGGLLTIAVPAQRYYITLLPIACLWAAHGLAALTRPWLAPRPARPQPTAAHD